jgi:hypothetical protein
VFLSYFALVSVLSKDKNKMLIYNEKQNLPLDKKTNMEGSTSSVERGRPFNYGSSEISGDCKERTR